MARRSGAVTAARDRRCRKLSAGIGRGVSSFAVVALVIFHAVLLWDRIASSTLLDPAVALRWSGTALLLLAFARLQRAGVPLLSGHRARVIWTLVALLHASMVPGVAGSVATLGEASPELWLTLAVSALLATLGASAAAAAATTGGRLRPRLAPAETAVRDVVLPSTAARPPPVS